MRRWGRHITVYENLLFQGTPTDDSFTDTVYPVKICYHHKKIETTSYLSC